MMRLLISAFISLGLITASHAATLADQQVQPGGKIEIRFPVSKYFQDIAALSSHFPPVSIRRVPTRS